ncbi:MAG: DUF1501 domain-containing protein [Leptospiraceae bacterium]|nr:DUF1501 domain-containing protein [Leptospiraceae bacterium]
MNRKEFLKLTSSGISLLPFLSLPIEGKETSPQPKTLVLIELKGGNDSLNTFIPYKEKLYYQLRPKLSVPADKIISLNGTLGLHPVLTEMKDIWNQGKLALFPGIGYEDPNRSHFRSIDIWDTASDEDEFLSEGWISEIFKANNIPEGLIAHGIIIGSDDEGPLFGRGMRNVVIQNIRKFLNDAKHSEEEEIGVLQKEIKKYNGINPSLSHILTIQKNLLISSIKLREKIKKPVQLKIKFPQNRSGKNFELAAQIIGSEVPIPVIKITLGGFDTHKNQKPKHEKLLKELSSSLASFEKAMKELGRWDDILVLSYSEFGRRVKENGSDGTDHGAAATHFALGGKVKGGIYGTFPDLNALHKGDLKYTTDYRSIYRTIVEDWWTFKNHGRIDIKDKIKLSFL